jgi:hypothetical protein
MDERTGVDVRARVRWDAAVPKYDAFGREIGENTLAGLGGESNAAAAPRAEPAPADGWSERAAPAEPPTQARPERPQVKLSGGAPVTALPGARPRRSKGLGCLISLLVFVGVIVVGPIIAITTLVDDAQDAIEDVTGTIDPDALDLPEPPNMPESGPPPSGITGRSLIATRNFRNVLRVFEQGAFSRSR